MEGCDMIVGLYHLPEEPELSGIRIKRAFVGEKEEILDFVRMHFQKNWAVEAEHAMMQEVPKCFIATEAGKVVGFCCFDSSARGFFGPIGVDPGMRGRKVGQALLLRALHAMREYGYAYAVIGWVGDAEWFYRKTVGAEFIKGGTPENSVYSNLIRME